MTGRRRRLRSREPRAYVASAPQPFAGEAFSAFGSLLGLGAEDATYRAALRMLDDRLLEPDREGDGGLVNFINPGVEDFARARLAGSARTLEAVFDSAVFFDPVGELRTLLAAKDIDEDWRLRLLDAGIRLLDTVAARR